ncbi:stage III sporulation protein AE [Heliophilum fasciatum]|uniref:Stage III sporulation protein AE n=1 Tax=Heliophilum fasciatum TaxID=35700 RepID=A0A4R2RUT0_9FIRM|nr:stage III sporulation protein AE [Heliophilum fasciatum]MCW2277326.1 stage III sporulation protein AE [Heliophilum fasciatum]TCP67163.1 stage III sporulation protein AE [Heliophilum fasciatum]
MRWRRWCRWLAGIVVAGWCALMMGVSAVVMAEAAGEAITVPPVVLSGESGSGSGAIGAPPTNSTVTTAAASGGIGGAGSVGAVGGGPTGGLPTPDVDLTALEQFLSELEKDKSRYLPGWNPSMIIEDLRQGKIPFTIDGLFQGVMGYLFQEVVANTALLSQVVILAVVVAVLSHLQTGFEGGTTSKVAFAVGYMALITIALHSFQVAITTGQNAIDEMVRFMQAILPILLTLLTAMGGFISGALLHPMIFGTLTFISTLIRDWIFALIFFIAVLGMLGHIAPQFKVRNLYNLSKDGYKLLLGLLTTLFFGVISLYGAVGSVADGLALRTAKYATGNFVPVVGKLLADSFDLIIGSSLLLKNGLGLLGVMVIIVLCVLPALKILAMVLVYRLAGALLQPAGDSPVVDSLETIGQGLALVFGAVATVGLMFFLALTVVVGAGNLTVMLR